MRALTPLGLLHLVPLGVVGLLSWSVWLYRRVCSSLYRPFVSDYRTSVSLIVPVYREDPEILVECVQTWLAEEVDELILVVDEADDACLDALSAVEGLGHVRIIAFKHRGKRSALGVGIRAAHGDVIVLSDSDTAWTPGTLANLLMPFVDPRVGGVGTRQLVAARESSIWRRTASWLLNTRYLDYVPAMSRRGGVACLSGRTAAYRRAAVLPVLERLEREVFFGRECVAGDDGRLTWLVLAQGYRTVYQSSSVVVSMFPSALRAFLKQRIRWSRNSYRCYLTAARHGWLWRQPLITQVTVLQILVTPLSMTTGIAILAVTASRAAGLVVAGYVLWLFVGRGIRGLSHLREHPRDVLFLPVVALIVIALAAPVKLWAFFTMNKQGWLTRSDAQVGGEGQSAASLGGQVVRAA